MSSINFALGPNLNAAHYAWRINSFNRMSTTLVLYYDFILTLPQEIQFLWPPHNKQSWFTLACLMNRYVPLIGVLPVAVSYFIQLKPNVCGGLHIYYQWFVLAGQIQAGILCLLRVYALYGRSRRILSLLLFLGAGTLVTALVSIYLFRKSGSESIEVISPFGGCIQFTSHSGGRFSAIAWAGALVFDTAIFSLTLYKALTIGRGVVLLNVIVRDGTMYFSALSLMNLGNIMTLLFGPPLLKASITSYTNVLTTILVNRLVLNLRERASMQLPTAVETAGRFQAALPDGLKPAAGNDIRSIPPPFQESRSTDTVTVETTDETVASMLVGEF